MNAYILAGGKNSRIKISKAFLKIGKKYIIDIILEKLSKSFDNVYIVIKKEHQKIFEKYSDLLIIEKEETFSSLIGILTALSHTNEEWNFIIGSDMPGTEARLVKAMKAYTQMNKKDAIVPLFNNYVEPLFSFYNKKILPIVEDQVKKKELKIQLLYEKIDILYIPENIIKKYDPQLLSFLNINTEKDYKEAMKKLSHHIFKL